MILEGIVTTIGPDGSLNVAPMGPRVEPDRRHFVLRPYQTSTTFRNLRANGEGVLHVVDDVLLLARAAIGRLDLGSVATRPAEAVRGRVLLGACRYDEFRVTDIDASEPRATLRVASVAEGRFREFFGLNRAKHAVVEAAILATRLDFLPLDEVLADLDRLAPLVEKTGGPDEREAFDLLAGYIRKAADRPG